MAKKLDPTEYDLDPRKPTRPPQAGNDNNLLTDESLNEGVIRSAGVGLKDGEIRAIDTIAESLGVKRNALMRLAIRYFIQQVRAGKIDLEQFIHEPARPARKVIIPGEKSKD